MQNAAVVVTCCYWVHNIKNMSSSTKPNYKTLQCCQKRTSHGHVIREICMQIKKDRKQLYTDSRTQLSQHYQVWSNYSVYSPERVR